MKRARLTKLICQTLFVVPFAIVVGGCCCPCAGLPNQLQDIDETVTLADARAGHTSQLNFDETDLEPLPEPPPNLYQIVHYDSPAGNLSAFLSVDPGDGQKHPAIIWITGGYCNSVGDTPWMRATRDDDQSAQQYRNAGIVMMYPALRGGSGNPGNYEGFYGEVDDVLAARDFLAQQSFVDPQRIYLGGHSTGGTLVLLAAEMGGDFRGVFSFGPVDDVEGYGPDYLPAGNLNQQEIRLRSPGYWLHSIGCPTFVFEGTDGNVHSLRNMRDTYPSTPVEFFEVPGADHFNILAPMNALIAQKILADSGPTSNISFTLTEITAATR